MPINKWKFFKFPEILVDPKFWMPAHQTNSSLFEFLKMICFCFKSQLCLSSLVIDMRECQKTVTRNLASAAHQFMNSYYYYEKRAKRVYVVMIMLS